MELKYPGIYAFEEPTVPTVEGVGVSAGAMVGIAERGPINKVGFVTNFTQFIELYGSYYLNNYLAFAVEDFFKQGGTRLYISRVVGESSASAEINLPDSEIGVFPSGDTSTHAAATVFAKYPGAYGDNLNINTTKFETVLTDVALDEATTLTVADASGFELNDVICVRGSLVRATAIIVGINYIDKELTVLPLDIRNISDGNAAAYPGDGVFVAGDTVKTSTTHAVSGYLLEDLVGSAGDYVVKVSNTTGLVKGSIIIISDADNVVEGKIKKVSGTEITFELLNSITASAIVEGDPVISAGGQVSSMGFFLTIYEDSALVDIEHRDLNMENTDEVNHVEVRLYGDDNQSDYIKVDDLDNTDAQNLDDAFFVYRFPAPVSKFLDGGDDGSTPTDANYKGTNPPTGEKRGIHLFDSINENLTIGIPGVTSVSVIRYGIDYCASRGDSIYVAEVPREKEEPLEAKDFRMIQLNTDSSYGALYYPWLKINHPINEGQTLIIPPSGKVIGVYSEVAARRGVHKAPANEELKDVIDLTYPVDNQTMAILNDIGVNSITAQFQGRGVRVFGARTLQNKKDGYHFVPVRRLMNYVKASILAAVPDAPFEPNDEVLWASLEQRIRNFLRGLWDDGMLFPRSDVTKAFFVHVNAETNPPRVIDLGQVRGRVGINPPKPAEKVVFFFTLMPTGGVEFEGA